MLPIMPLIPYFKTVNLMPYNLYEKSQLTIIALALPFTLANCTSNDPESQFSQVVTAKIIQPTCGGTVMQVIDGEVKGEDWKSFFTSSNQTAPYENSVLVGNVPVDRQIPGDVLQFSYTPGLTFGQFCEIGGLPKSTISVIKIK
jgi:hypothetical protein